MLLVPDDLWLMIEPLLPPERAKPKGGRPRAPDRAALAGILFVLRTGIQWREVPAELGCCGKTCWRRLAGWHAAGVWAGLHRTLLERLNGRATAGLEPRRPRQRQPVGKKGGAEVGANPTDRGRPGTKRHLVTDARGTPLGVALSGANRHDSMMLVATLDAVPGVRARHRGRPRKRPDKLHADKGYDHRRCRRECRARGITPRIARRGVESSARLGRHRWVAERSFAWLARFPRLSIRHKRHAVLHLALIRPAAPSSACARSGGFVPSF